MSPSVAIDQYLPTIVLEIQLSSKRVLLAPRVLHNSAQSSVMTKVKKERSLKKGQKLLNDNMFTCYL